MTHGAWALLDDARETLVKRLLVLLVLLGACRSAPATTTPAPVAGYGAPAARAAVESFFAAIKAGDLQAISMVWGNEKGPLVNDRQVTREEIEKRELLMICYLNHDEARVLDRVQAGEPAYTVFQTELKKGGVVRRPTISTVQGPQGRWFVVDADIQAVRDFCQPNGGNRPPG
jgi:hypothetical protein